MSIYFLIRNDLLYTDLAIILSQKGTSKLPCPELDDASHSSSTCTDHTIGIVVVSTDDTVILQARESILK